VIGKVADAHGIESLDWSWCQRQNGTWADCPISEYAASTDFSMVIATHNPANLALNTIEVKVPHGNFKVSKL
jgi:hypothetical protein